MMAMRNPQTRADMPRAIIQQCRKVKIDIQKLRPMQARDSHMPITAAINRDLIFGILAGFKSVGFGDAFMVGDPEMPQ